MKAKACPECRQLSPSNTRFCGKCGYDYRPAEAVRDGVRMLAKRGHGMTKKKLLVGIAIFLLIVFIVALL